jgi:hypothetical protein
VTQDPELTPSALDASYVGLPAGLRPTMFVIVDTEEEFDWNAPLARENTAVGAMRYVERLQSVLDPLDVTPTYVVDYPVASQRDGYSPLLDLSRSGRAVIGAHLHPWVNPPFHEEITPRNSFGFRLGAIETEKIRVLRSTIEESFGISPTVFKAGRYGFGVSTAAALETLGFDVDVSINPHMNFSDEGGPVFNDFDAAPFFFGRSRRLLEIPCSTGYAGLARRTGRTLHALASRPALRRLRAVGVLARLGIVNKVMLSPEGHTLPELKALTRTLLASGIRTFSLTLHSPSMQPGCTPYVQTRRELDRLLDCVRGYCEFFLGDLAGTASTPERFYRLVEPA